ncbi:MAG: universal stress protein [Nitrospiraceae bacterium]|nr:MAG: universal stress protein [Nitrospiraceae bacterium]
MKKILVAVDDTKGIKNSFSICENICSCIKPETIVLLYVEKFEGRSLIDEMLGDAEISTLREVLSGTEYKEALDRKANSVLDFYKSALEKKGLTNVTTVIKGGHPAEEIIKTAQEEGAELIMLGSRGNRTSHMFMGSVSREVVNMSDIPVLVAKSK